MPAYIHTLSLFLGLCMTHEDMPIHAIFLASLSIMPVRPN